MTEETVELLLNIAAVVAVSVFWIVVIGVGLVWPLGTIVYLAFQATPAC